MHARRLVLAATAAVALAGCTSLGLDPRPEAMHPEGSSSVGLNPFPHAINPGKSSSLGLDPFATAPHRYGTSSVGLNPFPKAMNPKGNSDLGLNPFPKPRRAKGTASLGLNPWPKGLSIFGNAREPDEGAEEERLAKEAAAIDAARAAKESAAAAKAPAPPPPPPPDRLERKFRLGENAARRSTITTSIVIPTMSPDSPYMTTTATVTGRQKVVEANADGSGVIEIAVEAVDGKVEMPAMGMETAFDTRKPETLDSLQGNPGASEVLALTRLAGKSFRLGLSRDGKIVAVKAPEGKDGGEAPQVAALLEGVFGGFPSDPVRAGLSWDATGGLASPLGQLAFKGKNTVSSWDEATKTAVLKMEGTATASAAPAGAAAADPDDPQAAMAAEMAKQVKVKKGVVTGESTFDVRAGSPSKSKVTMALALEIPNPMGGDEPMEIQVTVAATSELVK